MKTNTIKLSSGTIALQRSFRKTELCIVTQKHGRPVALKVTRPEVERLIGGLLEQLAKLA